MGVTASLLNLSNAEVTPIDIEGASTSIDLRDRSSGNTVRWSDVSDCGVLLQMFKDVDSCKGLEGLI